MRSVVSLLLPISDDNWDVALWLCASGEFDEPSAAELLRMGEIDRVLTIAKRDGSTTSTQPSWPFARASRRTTGSPSRTSPEPTSTPSATTSPTPCWRAATASNRSKTISPSPETPPSPSPIYSPSSPARPGIRVSPNRGHSRARPAIPSITSLQQPQPAHTSHRHRPADCAHRAECVPESTTCRLCDRRSPRSSTCTETAA